MRSVRVAAALAAATVALAGGAGCGDDGDEDVEPATQGVGQVTAGSVAQLAQCRDWVEGTPEEQLATIIDIRGQVNRESGTVQAPALTNEEAQGLFDRACANDYAQTFRLYVLYVRAAGYIPLLRDD